MPTNAITGKRRECTTVERVRIIELSALGFSQRGIAEKLAIHRAIVGRILREWKQSQKIQPAQRSRRPHALTARDKRHLFRLSDAHPYVSLQQLTTLSGLTCCAATAGRALRASGRYVRSARVKPFISTSSRARRVTWARAERHTSIEQWRRRIFTDEIYIELSPRGIQTSAFKPRYTLTYSEHSQPGPSSAATKL